MAVAKREGTTAYLVIKRHFTRILDISPEEITDFLYSDGVITLNDLEHATNKLYTSKDRTRKLIMSLQKAVKRNHEHFEHFCDYLIENKPALGYSEIAQTMKDAYLSDLETQGKGQNCSTKVTQSLPTCLHTAPSQPDILWICASEEIYQLAKEQTHVSALQGFQMTPDKKFKYLELEPDMRVLYHPHGDHLRSSVVWLMYPMSSDSLKLESIRKLLHYYNKVRFFIFTSAFERAARQSSSKIYVPGTFENGSPFIAELRHISALWQLRKKKVERSWICDTDSTSSAVQFCTLDDAKTDEVVSFYTAANDLWREGIKTFHVAILSDQSKEGCATCRHHPAIHSVQYSYDFINYLASNLPWKFRTCSL